MRTPLISRFIPGHKSTFFALFTGIIFITLRRFAQQNLPTAFRTVPGHLGNQRFGIFTLWKARASQKFTEPSRPNHHLSTTFFTNNVAFLFRHLDPGTVQLFLGRLQLFIKIFIKFLQNLYPLHLPGLDLIQLVFHLGGKFQIYDILKHLFHQTGDNLAQRRRHKRFFLPLYIFPAGQRGNRRRIRARTPNTVFLHGFDQRRLGIPGGRLGKVLVGRQIGQFQYIAVFQRRQRVLLFLRLVFAFFIQDRIPVKFHTVSAGLKQIIIRCNIRLHRI